MKHNYSNMQYVSDLSQEDFDRMRENKREQEVQEVEESAKLSKQLDWHNFPWSWFIGVIFTIILIAYFYGG